MCGICGFVTPGDPPPDPRALVERMAEALAHRGPDDAGAWVEGPIALGHRRLAVIDPTARGHQPMVAGDFAVVLNGEIYDHRRLRKQLTRGGRRFASRTDTEVLLHGAAVWGVDDLLERLDGMFAFALWDRREETLVLARDPMGEKPLYYGWVDGCLAFGSALLALRRVGGGW